MYSSINCSWNTCTFAIAAKQTAKGTACLQGPGDKDDSVNVAGVEIL